MGYVEPAAPRPSESDAFPDLQQLYFCPVCVRSRRPSLELLSTLTCSLQSLMVTLPEATAADNLYRRATCWRGRVQQILQSDEVRAVQNEQADNSLMSRFARSHSGYILHHGITIIIIITTTVTVYYIALPIVIYHCSVP